MAAVVHRHNLLTRKRDKNAASSVALPDSIGIRNAAVITIGSIALVKTTFRLKAHVKRYAVILVSARRHLDTRLERFVHNIMNRSANSVAIYKGIGYTKHKFFSHKLQTFE